MSSPAHHAAAFLLNTWLNLRRPAPPSLHLVRELARDMLDDIDGPEQRGLLLRIEQWRSLQDAEALRGPLFDGVSRQRGEQEARQRLGRFDQALGLKSAGPQRRDAQAAARKHAA